MSTSSCRCRETQVMEFQQHLLSMFNRKYGQVSTAAFINLDFHSIPHDGDKSVMENIWCGARGKPSKGANTVFAQDRQRHAIVSTRADILRSEEAEEVKKFVTSWRRIQGDVDETLVFDGTFTPDKVLDE